MVSKSKCKLNKLWDDQKKKKNFYNSSMQNWLDDDDVLMHLTHNLWRVESIKNWELMIVNLIVVIWIN